MSKGNNSGHYNSGHYNSGHYNSGHYNSGHHNSGHWNSGHCNSGHYNSGHCNSGNYNSGWFNTDEPTVRIFNKDTGKKLSELKNLPFLNLKITAWISEGSMTDQQKASDPEFRVKGGTLIKRSYKEAYFASS